MIIKNQNLHIRRFEFKYIIRNSDLDNLRKAINNFTSYDIYIDPRKGFYPVTSMYFDSVNYESYYEKLAGLKLRRKFRIRYYEENPKPKTTAFFEIKKRDEVIIFKDRFISNIQTIRRVLSDGEYGCLESKRGSNDFLNQVLTRNLRPTVLVSYKREAYVDEKNSNFRLTFDRELKAQRAYGLDFDFKSDEIITPGFSILEAKFNRIMPAWFGMVIKAYSLSCVSFSKYCFSLESCGIVTKIQLPTYSPWI